MTAGNKRKCRLKSGFRRHLVCGGLKQEGIPATDKICGKVACDMAKRTRPSSPQGRESGIVRFGND
ncbi:hypothetical protein HMPREF0602_1316 [Neisseria meningitidis ATCC 13091]|uniref:Uncharacterized protein n=3 Tax=Neisseria meningitidis TaxID=487 RepID=E0N9Y6_NEIM3|nr:hypothetical protein HMPREF0602_1316 [Neisseria meningitidis ATCC 13091]CBA04375.1 hypothetical protein predicted by Glimmer/Critica [Neisseria meningitidis alpha153]CCA45043.1 hypothetical protein NMALPHA522_1502 [Neisseria meningitidis alpha522]